MRILFACEFYYPSIGGVQEVVRQIAERLVERGHQVTVATTHLRDRQSREINGVQIEEFRVSGNLVRGIRGEVERYRNYVLNAQYDVFMVKAAQQWTFDALTPILDRLTKPKIFVPCGFSCLYAPEYAAYFHAMPKWLREFDRLIFYATDYRDINLARKHKIENISIVPNGADEREFTVAPDRDFRARLAIPHDAFVVLTVGSLTGLKGHLDLARAFERCDFGGRRAFLILNGNEPRRDGSGWRSISALGPRCLWIAAQYKAGGPIRVVKSILRPVLIRLGLGWLLRRLGYDPALRALPESVGDVVKRVNALPERRAIVIDLPRPELVQAYLNSDLFAFASNIEYSPLVLYEAAAAGLPFVSAPVGNAAEIANWTGAGVICSATVDTNGFTRVDVNDLARLISKLSAEPKTLAYLGECGRRNWGQRFTWDKISRLYEKIFEECTRSSA